MAQGGTGGRFDPQERLLALAGSEAIEERVTLGKWGLARRQVAFALVKRRENAASVASANV